MGPNIKTRRVQRGKVFPKSAFVLLTLALCLAANPALSRFKQGDMQLSAGGGGGATGFGLDGEFGYFALDGFQVSFGAGYWSMEQTGLFRVTPGARFVFETEQVMPYIGVFYREWLFTDDAFTDMASVGGRLGSYFVVGETMGMTVGLVHERLMDCDGSQIDECAFYYPEFSLAFQL
jgi:hypothetical protein